MKRSLAVAAAFIMTLAMLSGCEYLDDGSEDQGAINARNAPGIGGVITAAIDAYNAYGVESFYPFLAADVRAVCTAEEFAADMSDAAGLVALREMKSVEYPEFRLAEVTVVLVTADGDVEQVWKMVQAENGVWFVLDMPGMGECKVA